MDLGFDGVSHNGVPIIYDESCPVDRAYFLNDTYLRLHILGDNNMKNVDLDSTVDYRRLRTACHHAVSVRNVEAIPHPRCCERLSIRSIQQWLVSQHQ